MALTDEELKRRQEETGIDLSEAKNINDLAAKKRKVMNFKKPAGNKKRSDLIDTTKEDTYNTDLIKSLMALRTVKKPESDEETEDRIATYFAYCADIGLKPTVEALALTLGVDTRQLYRWRDGVNLGETNRSPIIKEALQFMAAFDAQAVLDGKIGYVPYIFRSKNFYGMKDQVEHVTVNDDKKVLTDEELARKFDEDIIDVEIIE